MNALAISPASIDGNLVQTVNARDLHAFLGVATSFRDWIARRIAEYGFAEGKDFCSFLSESQGGRPAKEYALTLDMGKELAMVERTEKGKEARAYFIECERKAQSTDPMLMLNNPAAMRTLLLGFTEKVLALESQVGELTPKAEALERIADADGLMPPMNAAKALQVQPKRLFDFLRTHNWTYRRAGARSDVAYQDKIAAGYLTHKVHIARRDDGSEKVCEQVMVTPKGLAKLAQVMGAH